MEIHFHYISSSVRKATASGNKEEINKKRFSALFPLLQHSNLSFELYLHLDFCRNRKAAHIKILKELIHSFHQDDRNLKTYPGVGVIGSATFIAYLENGWRLKNKRKLWQYCGVGVRRHESAGKGRRKASRQGNRYFKNAVMTAAATIANRRIADNALTKLWRAGIAAGVPGDSNKRLYATLS